MKIKILISTILLAVFLFGCTQTSNYGYPTAPQQPSQPSQQATPIAVTLLSAPTTAVSGQPITFSWRVDGPSTTIPHTSVHYDFVSHTGTFDTAMTPQASGYPKLIPNFAHGNYSIPQTFTASITVNQTGTLYYRAHAIVNGLNYWTDEKTITVTAPPQPAQAAPPQSTSKQFTILADDYGFYMGGQPVSYVNVNRGDSVSITFQVNTMNVYHAGLDFRGCGQTSSGTVPGSSTTMQFTAMSTCGITAYWPSTSTAKKTLSVAVS